MLIVYEAAVLASHVHIDRSKQERLPLLCPVRVFRLPLLRPVAYVNSAI